MIFKENTDYGDIVQGNFVDSYHNLSYKATMGNLWVSHFCKQAEFVVKTDDDMFIDLFEVIQLYIIHTYSLFLEYVPPIQVNTKCIPPCNVGLRGEGVLEPKRYPFYFVPYF